MNTHDIELPAEFRSGNDIPVTQATIKRERMEEILRDAIEADRQRQYRPVYEEGWKDALEWASKRRGEPWMPIESCPGGNGVRYLFVRDCGQGTLPAVEMGYMLDADTEVYMDSTHEPFTKYGYRVTHWMHLPGLPNTPQPAEPVLDKYQPCGCVICTCEDEVQCQGCGARHCGRHPIGELSDPVYVSAEPVKSTCKKCNGTGVESTRFHGVWPNGEECLEPIKCDQCDGFGTTSAAEPVKHKRQYAQGTALGEFGIIPMCDQVDDEPVKVPSDAQLKEFWRQLTEAGGDEVDFARALLDRYGQQAQPSDDVIQSLDEFTLKYLPKTHEEQKRLQERFNEWVKFDDDIARLGVAAKPSVPEPLKYGEKWKDHYVTGWNNCRAAMLAAEQAQQDDPTPEEEEAWQRMERRS